MVQVTSTLIISKYGNQILIATIAFIDCIPVGPHYVGN